MRQRWETLMRPDADQHVASPSPGEALGVWMLGILWAIVCLWLGYLGSHWVIPGLLLAGLLALWGWRHIEWLWWFPVIVVVATTLQPLAPPPALDRFGPLRYIDLLAICVAVVSVVRAVGLGLPLLPRTSLDKLVLVVLGLFALNVASSETRALAFGDFKRCLVTVVVFYATTTVASRPLGSRWVWIAFPLATALIGLHAVVAQLQGAGTLAMHAGAADWIWGSDHGIVNALMVALPVSVGLAIDAGQARARMVWRFASGIGLVALAMHLGATDMLDRRPAWGGLRNPVEFWKMLIALVTLVTLAAISWSVRAGRRHEGPRWVALTLTFVAYGFLQLVVPALSGPALALLAVAAGLVAGTSRADRRAMRSGRAIVPPLRKAA